MQKVFAAVGYFGMYCDWVCAYRLYVRPLLLPLPVMGLMAECDFKP